MAWSVSPFRRVRLSAAAVVIAVALTGWRLAVWVPDGWQNRLWPSYGQLRRGDSLAIPQVDWSYSSTNVILYVLPGCHACDANADFYRTVSERIRTQHDKRLIVAAPVERSEALAWLRTQSVFGGEVIKVKSPTSLGIVSAPTVLLVDRKGRVQHVFAGRQSPEAQREILNALGL